MINERDTESPHVLLLETAPAAGKPECRRNSLPETAGDLLVLAGCLSSWLFLILREYSPICVHAKVKSEDGC